MVYFPFRKYCRTEDVSHRDGNATIFINESDELIKNMLAYSAVAYLGEGKGGGGTCPGRDFRGALKSIWYQKNWTNHLAQLGQREFNGVTVHECV